MGKTTDKKTTYKTIDKVGRWAYTVLNDDGGYTSLLDITTDDDAGRDDTLALYSGDTVYTKKDAKGKNAGGLRYFVEVTDVKRKPSQKAAAIDKLVADKLVAALDKLVATGMSETDARAMLGL